jgi:hypothetical protein
MRSGSHRDLESLEARVGLRLGSLLSEQAELAPHDIHERLRFAREQALKTARTARAQHKVATPTLAIPAGKGVLALLSSPPRWLVGMASVLPLLLLVGGLALIDEWHDRAQIVAAADVDTALLTDALPPNAYNDAGFVEYLRTARN